MKVLYAEDENELRKLTVEALTQNGMEVVAVEDGDQAWEKYLGEEEFDLILLDNYMPGKTGTEVLKDIRARKDNVLVVILTSLIVPEMYALGADACIEKTYRFNIIIDELNAAIAKGRKPIPEKKKSWLGRLFG